MHHKSQEPHIVMWGKLAFCVDDSVYVCVWVCAHACFQRIFRFPGESAEFVEIAHPYF